MAAVFHRVPVCLLPSLRSFGWTVLIIFWLKVVLFAVFYLQWLLPAPLCMWGARHVCLHKDPRPAVMCSLEMVALWKRAEQSFRSWDFHWEWPGSEISISEAGQFGCVQRNNGGYTGQRKTQQETARNMLSPSREMIHRFSEGHADGCRDRRGC